MTTRLEKLQEEKARVKAIAAKRKAQIDAKIADLKKREAKAERKRDTRRKIIAGGLATHHMKANPTSDFAKKLAGLIDEYVIGDNERALFDLDPLTANDQLARKTKHQFDAKRKADIQNL